MSTSRTRTALVVGAGIGGLCAALCLRRAGFNVRVLERAMALEEVGAGIQLSRNALCVLDALGVTQRLRQTAVAPVALTMRRGFSGRKIFSIPVNNAEGANTYWHVHRADLITALSQTLTEKTPDAIEYGATVSQCNASAGSVTLSDGSQRQADLIVGADGIHSTIRDSVVKPTAPHFTGHVAWRMTVPTDALGADAPEKEACVWVGAGRHAVTYQLRDGALSNLVGVVEADSWHDESWYAQGTQQQALDDFDHWHPTIMALIREAATHFRWALFERAPLSRWHKERAVLLGDACHAMLPFMAQGGAMAIEDAWVLAALMQNCESEQAALNHYFGVRQPRTNRVQQVARANARIFHRQTPLSQVLTYLPMAVAGHVAPRAIANRLRWLYDEDVVKAHPIPAQD